MLRNFFISLLELFGLTPAKPDLGYNMRGWNCDYEQEFTAYYDYIGWGLVIVPFVLFLLYYFVIDSARFNRRGSWFIFLLIGAFSISSYAFANAYSIMNTEDFSCIDFVYHTEDIIALSAIAFVWAAFAFFFWSLVYRLLGIIFPTIQNKSINTRNVPWKQ